jgi:hypothetical protein
MENTMNRSIPLRITLLAFGLAIATQGLAQDSTEFPRERDRPASCDDFQWSDQMLREYPRVVDACQEVVVVGDQTFARLSAGFVRVHSDGLVSFNIRDRRDRYVDELTIQPVPGQMAYINDRPTEFRNLRTTDAISLYAAEGEYGFATQPVVVAREQRAVVRTVAALPTPLPVEGTAYDSRTAVAQVDRTPDMLPQTAGVLPWVALAGLLTLFSGLGLAIRRSA